MSKTQRLISIVLIVLVALACNLPNNSGSATEPPSGADPNSPTPTFTGVPTFTETPVPVACEPIATANTDVNIRNGPGQVYGIVGLLPQGGSAKVAGKNADGSWWYIVFAGGQNGYAWVAGSVTTATCIPTALAIVAAPPTPILPSSTPTLVPSSTPTGGLIFVPGIIIQLIPSNTPTPIDFNFPVFPTIVIPNL